MIGEQPYTEMLFWHFSNIIIYVKIVGKIPDQRLSVWLFSNPGKKDQKRWRTTGQKLVKGSPYTDHAFHLNFGVKVPYTDTGFHLKSGFTNNFPTQTLVFTLNLISLTTSLHQIFFYCFCLNYND